MSQVEMFKNKYRNTVTSEMRRVFICAHPSDTDAVEYLAQDVISDDAGVDCLVTWLTPGIKIDTAELRNTLFNTSVMLVFVTPNLISEIRIMQKLKRPYFPVATVQNLLDSYNKVDEEIHGLFQKDNDYREKLKTQLEKIILSSDRADEIKAKAFDHQIFLSYRKTDVEVAHKLMREFHDLPEFETVSIWYDRFLTAGEDFNNEIMSAIKDSKSFMMAITPNIATKNADGVDNFVVKYEYPQAKEKGCPIVPVIATEGDYGNLKDSFKGIPDPLTLQDAWGVFPAVMRNHSPTAKTSERLYYLGRAYESGTLVEQDTARCIKLFEQSAAKWDDFAIIAARHLADIYNDGKLVGSISYENELRWRKRGAEISEKVFGKEHPSTAATYNNIAVVYYLQGDYSRALEWYGKTRIVFEKVLGKEHPSTAATYNNIALVYSRQGDYSRALEWYGKALDIREKVLGKEHPSTATTYNNIALVYDSRGDYPRALEWYGKALDIREKVLGKEHPSTAATYNNIAGVYYLQGGAFSI